jgi:hypothetical protein
MVPDRIPILALFRLLRFFLYHWGRTDVLLAGGLGRGLVLAWCGPIRDGPLCQHCGRLGPPGAVKGSGGSCTWECRFEFEKGAFSAVAAGAIGA